MTFKAPFITYREVGEQTEQLLAQYHPSLDLPIPIEHIIEFDLKLRIHPVHDMYKILRESAFLGQSRKVIYVDEYQYDNFIEKYRFTLAHEVGHYFLHKSLYAEISFNSEQEYIEWIQSRPNQELNWYEAQANWFAAQLLVPREVLKKKCIDLLESNREIYSESDYLPYEFWSNASPELATISDDEF
jgi:hypothetical protein